MTKYYLNDSDRPGWHVVSSYQEEEIVEACFETEQEAQDAIIRVREFRGDQNEIPLIKVEDHR